MFLRYKWFVKESIFRLRHPELINDYLTCGWGNGYVCVNIFHPFYTLHYDDVNQIINVHGGLTFSAKVTKAMSKTFELDKSYLGMKCFGFDTAHYGDNLERWPKEKVEEETKKLLEQIKNQKFNPIKVLFSNLYKIYVQTFFRRYSSSERRF